MKRCSVSQIIKFRLKQVIFFLGDWKYFRNAVTFYYKCREKIGRILKTVGESILLRKEIRPSSNVLLNLKICISPWTQQSLLLAINPLQ